MPEQNRDRTAGELLEVLSHSADATYIGEPVSQLTHALQCAHFASKSGASSELVLAALFHDLGHLVAPPGAGQMAALGVIDHERLGAEYLRARGFSERVCDLVLGHVQGKRYLTYKSPTYFAALSEASRGTLKFQGGPMSAEEAGRFESDPLFAEKTRLRKFDEAAKAVDLEVAPLEAYRQVIQRHLEENQMNGTSTWKSDGFVLLKNHYRGEARELLRSYVEEMQAWPETPGKWMKYFERTAAGERLLCRVENFLPYHQALSDLLKGKEVLERVSELMGEQAILFKEKINYKLPGGNGFTAHQDAPAFTTFKQRYHITLMISVDATTVENGCLEIVRGREEMVTLPQGPDGAIDPAYAETLRWETLTTEPGDVLLFDSYIAHRSAKNRTNNPRRAYYITYNRASEGDRRDDYYRDKRENFPPEIERVPGRDYSKGAGQYNVGNPITK